jgi:hypothetical protein
MAKTSTPSKIVSAVERTFAIAALDDLFDRHFDPKRTDIIVNTVLEALGFQAAEELEANDETPAD